MANRGLPGQACDRRCGRRVGLKLGLFGFSRMLFFFPVFLLEVGKFVSCPTLFSIITAALSPADQSQ